MTFRVEAAFGANLRANPATWTYVDITRYVRGSIQVGSGRQDWLSQTPPAHCEFRLANDDGRFTPRFPASPYYPNVRRNVPVRVYLNAGTGDVKRFDGYIDDYVPTFTTPTLAEVTITAKGILKRLGQGQAPVKSALRRAVSDAGPLLYWPCEDTSGAVALAEDSGKSALSLNGAVTLGSAGPPGSAGAVTVGDGVELRSAVVQAAGSSWVESGWSVEWCVYIPEAPAATTVIARWDSAVTSGSSTGRWSWTVSLQPGSPGNLILQRLDTSGAVSSVNTSVPFTISAANGAPYARHLLITVSCASPVTDVGLTCVDIVTGDYVSTATTFGGSAGAVSAFVVPGALRPGGGWRYSHISVWLQLLDSPWLTPSLPHLDAAQAWDGETAGDRLSRLCAENGIPFTAPSVAQTAMGPQRGNSLLTLLRECESADQGILYDGVTPGLSYLPSDARYNQSASMTLDRTRGQLKTLFEPHEDDQRVRNDVTASRAGGSSVPVADADHIDANGLYADAIAVNVWSDAQLPDQAGWRVNVGTVEEMRIPALSINLTGSPELQAPWLAMGIGKRFDALNLPPQYPPGPYEAVLEGYTETFDAAVYRAVLNSSPFAPWRVFQIAAETGDTSEFVGRLDLEGVTLQSALTAQPTGTVQSWAVLVTGTLITTLADDLTPPIQIVVDGEVMYVTGVTGTTSPQTLTVRRAMNGVVKAHSAGAAVSLYRPLVLAL